VDPVAAFVFDYTWLCLKPANRGLLCPALLVAGKPWSGSLAAFERRRFLLGNYAMAENAAAQWDTNNSSLVGLTIASAVGDRQLQTMVRSIR
jgi:hypothetical protein